MNKVHLGDILHDTICRDFGNWVIKVSTSWHGSCIMDEGNFIKPGPYIPHSLCSISFLVHCREEEELKLKMNLKSFKEVYLSDLLWANYQSWSEEMKHIQWSCQSCYVVAILEVHLLVGSYLKVKLFAWFLQNDCFLISLFAVVFTGSILFALQQLSGINAVFYFSSIVFKSAGVPSDTANICVGVCNLSGGLLVKHSHYMVHMMWLFEIHHLCLSSGSIIAMLLMDKLGRKSLLIWSFSGMVGRITFIL